MQLSSVYFLVFHGSHDPRSQQAAKHLTEDFRQRISHTAQLTQATEQLVYVQDVYLECLPLPLHRQVVQAIAQLQLPAASWATIDWRMIPVFLLPGTHVMQDIPAALSEIQSDLPATLPLTVTPHLGSHKGLCRLLNERLSQHSLEAWILMAHGSRRAGANQEIERLAERVGAVTAYWSTAPRLAQRVEELGNLGVRRIGILPYFLFPGGITDAIAETVTQLTHQFPQLSLQVSQPLHVNQVALADLLVDLAVQSMNTSASTFPAL